MKRLKRIVSIGSVMTLIAAFSLALVSVPVAQADDTKLKVGVLTCAAGPSVGLLITSKEKINCSFQPNESVAENYHGFIRKIGLDVGVTAGSVIIWAVFAAQNPKEPGSLAGTYVGASAEETIVLGLGANVLVGGSNKSIVLQPLSVQAQAGLNLAIGVAHMELVEN